MTSWRYNVDHPKKLYTTHLSLCAGYGGIDLGLRNIFADLYTTAYCEIELYAIQVLLARMEEKNLDPAPIYTNLKTFPWISFRGSLSILSGGFPCQPFSNASNNKKGVEDPRHLYPYISEGIKQSQPAVIFLENVLGVIETKTKEGESVLHYVLKDLEQLGYRATAGIFSASEVGATHQRKRVFIMAHSRHRGHRERDTKKCRTEGTGIPITESHDRNIFRSTTLGCSKNNGELGHWPSRPNEPQYEWEEPRVIQAQSKLGGAAHGSASGVDPAMNYTDRLRILGNGVCPQTAELAFRVLSQRLLDGYRT